MAGMRASADQRGWGADQRGWGNEAPAKSAGLRTWAASAWLVAGTIAVAVTSYSLSLKVAAERRDVEKLARQNIPRNPNVVGLAAQIALELGQTDSAAALFDSLMVLLV